MLSDLNMNVVYALLNVFEGRAALYAAGLFAVGLYYSAYINPQLSGLKSGGKNTGYLVDLTKK
jgi:hypothetical protein